VAHNNYQHATDGIITVRIDFARPSTTVDFFFKDDVLEEGWQASPYQSADLNHLNVDGVLLEIQKFLGLAEPRFLVKLIEVKSVKNKEAKRDLLLNCTNVTGNLWLYEGDKEWLHSGVSFEVIDEQEIEAYGDKLIDDIKRMVCDTYALSDKHLVELGCVEP
jgi:hypothetical protein